MKRNIAAKILWALFIFSQTTFAKESKEVSKAFHDYEQNKISISKDDKETGNRLTQLLKKLNSKEPGLADPVGNIKEELMLLASIRAHPSKIHLENLTALWNYHQPRTYKVRYPENWKYVTGIDYDQKLCDEIADVYAKCGGDAKDLDNTTRSQ